MMYLRKLKNSFNMAVTLFMARIFGEYIVSGWDGHLDYHLYKYRGKVWFCPNSPYKKNDLPKHDY